MLITHAHADHIGSAAEAAAAGVDVRVHVDEVDRARGTYRGRAAAGPTDLPLWRPTIIASLTRLVRAGIMSQPPVLDLSTFADGDVLEVPGRPVVVHTPGHTEGHCAFHLPDRGVLFTGDAVVTDGFQGTRGPQMLAPPFHHDFTRAIGSLDRLAGLDADVVLPGHGQLFRGSPAELVVAVRETLA
jgi:glyoxylase-like metal-dependent hydrolase (beta-lactamase superfamily II)